MFEAPEFISAQLTVIEDSIFPITEFNISALDQEGRPVSNYIIESLDDIVISNRFDQAIPSFSPADQMSRNVFGHALGENAPQIIISAVDVNGLSSSPQVVAISFQPVNDPPTVLEPITPFNLLIGEIANLNLADVFADPDNSIEQLTFDLVLANTSSHPHWIDFSGPQILINPDEEGSFVFQLTAFDSQQESASTRFDVVVQTRTQENSSDSSDPLSKTEKIVTIISSIVGCFLACATCLGGCYVYKKHHQKSQY